MWRFVIVLVYCVTLAAPESFKVRRPIKELHRSLAFLRIERDMVWHLSKLLQGIYHKAPLPLGAEVDGCSNAPPPCLLKQLKTVFIPIAFRVPRFTTNLETRITTYQTINRFVSKYTDAWRKSLRTCDYLLYSNCPVREGEILLYPFQLVVDEPTFRTGEAGAYEIRIVDDTSKAIVCLRVEFVIMP